VAVYRVCIFHMRDIDGAVVLISGMSYVEYFT